MRIDSERWMTLPLVNRRDATEADDVVQEVWINCRPAPSPIWLFIALLFGHLLIIHRTRHYRRPVIAQACGFIDPQQGGGHKIATRKIMSA